MANRFFNFGRRGKADESVGTDVIQEDGMIREQNTSEYREVMITEDNSGNDLLYGDILSVTESTVSHSPETLSKMIDSDETKMEKILGELKSDYSSDETYKDLKEKLFGRIIEFNFKYDEIFNDRYKVLQKMNKLRFS